MKFTYALILFCLLASSQVFLCFFLPISPAQLVERTFFTGLGVFSCWRLTLPRSPFPGRLCRFFKAIPHCWAESKETSK